MAAVLTPIIATSAWIGSRADPGCCPDEGWLMLIVPLLGLIALTAGMVLALIGGGYLRRGWVVTFASGITLIALLVWYMDFILFGFLTYDPEYSPLTAHARSWLTLGAVTSLMPCVLMWWLIVRHLRHPSTPPEPAVPAAPA